MRSTRAAVTIAAAALYRLQVTSATSWLILRVEDADGRFGLGDASLSQDDDALIALMQRSVLRDLVGARVADIVGICGELEARLKPWSSGAICASTTVSATEQALIDLRARELGVSVGELLGAPLRDRVGLYANLNRGVQSKTAEAYASLARDAGAAGFRAVKLAPFVEVQRDDPFQNTLGADVAAGIERVEAVLNAVGPGCDVCVDCQGRFGPLRATRVGREMERLGVAWYEDPIWPEANLHALADVAKKLAIPVVSGESLQSYSAFATLLHAGAATIVMPDVKRCGGLRAAVRIAALAEGFGVDISPHNPAGPVATLASAHVGAVVPNFLMLEYPYAEVAWRAEIGGAAEQIDRGDLLVPEGDGLGLAWDPAEDVTHAERVAERAGPDARNRALGARSNC